MPDRDILHDRFASRLYIKPYRVLCEGKKGAGWLILGALKKDLQRLGDEPIRLAKEMAECLQPLAEVSPLEKQAFDWNEKSHEIDRVARLMPTGRHDTTEWVKEAAKAFLHGERYRTQELPDNLHEHIVADYMERAYRARFEERVPVDEHHKGADHQEAMKRLVSARGEVERGISAFAKKAAEKNTVEKLRRPRRQKIEDVKLHSENLLGG